MKRLYALTAVAALAAAAPAHAQVTTDGATRMGFSVGARAAYAWPFGDIAGGTLGTTKLSDAFDRMIPLWLDATLRLGGGFEVGPYFQYGWVSGKSGVSDAKDWRVGAQANYRLTPAGGMAPWLGVGAGWEWLKFDNSLPGGGNADVSGLELLVQGGADFRLSPNLALGPFIAFTFGRYSSGDVFNGTGVDKKWHEWLQVGAKLTFDL